MIWSLITSNLEWIIGGIGALLGIFFVRKSGKAAERADHLEKKADREERGRDAVAKEKAETTGSDNRTLVDRMRSRNRDRRGL